MSPTDDSEGLALRNWRPGAKLKNLRLIKIGSALVQGAAGSFDMLWPAAPDKQLASLFTN